MSFAFNYRGIFSFLLLSNAYVLLGFLCYFPRMPWRITSVLCREQGFACFSKDVQSGCDTWLHQLLWSASKTTRATKRWL